MKRFLTILTALLLLSGTVITAQEQGDEYDDGYVYTQNGAGDQFFKLKLGGIFPLNFGNHLYPGGTVELGYYRFLNEWFALGGEISATSSLSIGNKVLVMLPFTLGALAQPTIGKLEFPVHISAGISYETWQNLNCFPSFALKGSAGAFYRLNEMFSFGASSDFLWIPQPSKNGLFVTATIGARYHL